MPEAERRGQSQGCLNPERAIMKTTILLLTTAFVSGSASVLLIRAIGSSPDFWVNFLQVIGFILTLAISGASLNKLEKWIGKN